MSATRITAAATAIIGLFVAAANAQVEADGRVGNAGPVGRGLDSGGVLADHLIDAGFGEVVGENWFHSFETFTIDTGKIASYDSPAGVARIVTGVSAEGGAFIRGRLRSVAPGVDLFLLSPNGIDIGQDAVFDVKGSLHFSTADLLRMQDGVDFDAGGSATPVLSTASPLAFGFTREAPARISVGGSSMGAYTVPSGETLSFIGGDVILLGTNSANNTVRAPASTLQIASVASALDVPLDLADFDTGESILGALGTVTIGSRANIAMSAESSPSGTIRIRGGRFVAGESVLNVDHFGAEDSQGMIDVAVSGSVELGEVQLSSATLGTGRGSDVSVSGETVSLVGTEVLIGSAGAGDGGKIEFVGRELEFGEATSLRSLSTATGAGSTVELKGPNGDPAWRVVVRDGAALRTEAIAAGRGGSIFIDAADVEVRNAGQVESLASGSAASTGGSIVFGSSDRPLDSLGVRSGGMVATEAEGAARGGDIRVHADRVQVGNDAPGVETFVFTTTSARPPGAGAGGNLMLAVADLAIENGGQIFTLTKGAGTAGALSIAGAERVLVSGIGERADGEAFPASLAARVAREATGTGGTLSIASRVVEAVDGGEIASRTEGPGDAAPAGETALRIDAERVSVRGGSNGVSQINSASSSGLDGSGGGSGGDLLIETGVLELVDGGLVTASSTGADAGDAGKITIVADLVSVSGATVEGDPSGIFAQANSSPGAGGDIEIRAIDMTVTDGGIVSVSTRSSADAGTITLAIDEELFVGPGAMISATGAVGVTGDTGSIDASAARVLVVGGEISTLALGQQDAGQITVTGGESVLLDGAVVTSQAENGAGGNVTITAKGFVSLASSEVTASTAGAGGAGDVTIEAGRQFTAVASEVSTESTSLTDSSGGTIRINASELVEIVDSDVTTSVLFGEGDGGSIFIDPRFVVLNGATLIANAQTGNGGFIDINGSFLFRSGNTIIQASSAAGGLPGTINLRTPEADLTGKLVELPASFLDASRLLERECAVRTARAGSFVVETREILPAPDAPFRPSDLDPPREASDREECAP